MPHPHGFVWYDLLVDDVEAAQAFYTAAVGWSVSPGGMDEGDYRILSAGDDPVAGLMQRPADMPSPHAWIGYVGTDDVDADAAAIAAAGGAVHMPPMTLPGVGRMAMVADPQGTPFQLFAPEEESRSFQPNDAATPGHFVWNELTARDPDAAIAFYTERFGWRQEGSMPMGPLGDYRFLHAGPTVIGAAMGEVPGGRLGWRFYTMVDDIDAALARVEAAGGRGLQGPDEIPGGSFSLVAADPWGVQFGLVGPRHGGTAT